MWFASWGLQQCLGQPCNARKERSICNDLQTLIRAVREHCCNPQLYNSFLGFSRLLHSMFLDGTPYVAVLRSHPNYVWILMYCHAMPTHDVSLQHCRKMLLQVSTRRCISLSFMHFKWILMTHVLMCSQESTYIHVCMQMRWTSFTDDRIHTHVLMCSQESTHVYVCMYANEGGHRSLMTECT